MSLGRSVVVAALAMCIVLVAIAVLMLRFQDMPPKLAVAPEDTKSSVAVAPALLSAKDESLAAPGFARRIAVAAATLCLETFQSFGGSQFQLSRDEDRSNCFWSAPLGDTEDTKAESAPNTLALACDPILTGATGEADAAKDLDEAVADPAPPDEVASAPLEEPAVSCSESKQPSIFFNAKSVDGEVRVFRYKINTDLQSVDSHLGVLADQFVATLADLHWDFDARYLDMIRRGMDFNIEANGVRYRFKREYEDWRFNLITEILEPTSGMLDPYALKPYPGRSQSTLSPVGG